MKSSSKGKRGGGGLFEDQKPQSLLLGVVGRTRWLHVDEARMHWEVAVKPQRCDFEYLARIGSAE